MGSRGAVRFLSVTLTCRHAETPEQSRAVVLAAMRAYVAVFERLQRHVRGSGLVLVLDESNDEHVHVHGLLAVRIGLDEKKPLGWWRRLRLWAEPDAPVRAAQHVRPVELHGEALPRVLRHHIFNNSRKTERLRGQRSSLPLLHDRAVGWGTVWGLMARVLAAKGAAGPWTAVAATTLSSDARTVPPARRQASTDQSCDWCGHALEAGARVDKHRHDGCRQAASRAFATARAKQPQRLQGAFSAWVRALEDHHWRRLDALRAAAAIVWFLYVELLKGRAIAAALSPQHVGSLSRLGIDRIVSRARALEALRCACGRELPSRIDAGFCGRSCRVQHQRTRRRIKRGRPVGEHVLVQRAGRSGHVG
jgi:hypothetical protein